MRTKTKRMIPMLASLLMTAAVSDRLQAEQSGESGDRGKLSSSDQQFVMDAARGGLMEVQAGQLARERGSNQAVKDFGQRMIDDHGKANEDLKSLASDKGVTLPTELGEREQSHLDQLGRLSGAEFDREYSQMMLQDHQEDLKKFREAAERSDDQDVKAFASRMVSVLEQHLDSARQLQTQAGTQQGSNREQGSMRDDTSTNRSTLREPETTRQTDVIRERDITRERGDTTHEHHLHHTDVHGTIRSGQDAERNSGANRESSTQDQGSARTQDSNRNQGSTRDEDSTREGATQNQGSTPNQGNQDTTPNQGAGSTQGSGQNRGSGTQQDDDASSENERSNRD